MRLLLRLDIQGSSYPVFVEPKTASDLPPQPAGIDSQLLPAAIFLHQTPHTTTKSPLPATPITVVVVVVAPCCQSATLVVGGGVNTIGGDGIGGIAAADGGGELVGSD
ncbi:hypothetical protein Droror1_Dr00026096 [Drosera rotundifolia]